MRILIIGSGGRECTLAWKLAQSNRLDALYIAPGNAGTSAYGENIPVGVTDFPAIKQACLDNKIDMVLVGPEAPLVAGIYDFFSSDETLRHISVIGPSQEGAQLEGSKAYAKTFMARHGIPTAAYGEFTADTIDEGVAHLKKSVGPYVLKADGLAAGKGVLIIEELDEAIDALRDMLGGKFGEASSTVVIEEFLDGIEFSVFALTDGENYFLLPEAKDYKRIGEGDKGLNTGGMGAVSPVPFYTGDFKEKVIEKIVKPTIDGLKAEGISYHGFVFFGLISCNGEPYVIEYNCRMGDPETEAVIPRLENDLVEVLASVHNGTLGNQRPIYSNQLATTVMMVSGGYPEAYEKGKKISIPSDHDGLILHAGTTTDNAGNIVTNGGRVIAITTRGETIMESVQQALNIADKIDFDKKYYRTDIGKDLV